MSKKEKIAVFVIATQIASVIGGLLSSVYSMGSLIAAIAAVVHASRIYED